jgi:hypothetical protein
MSLPRLTAYFRFEAARTLLGVFDSSGIPADPDARAAALQPMMRALAVAEERGGRTLYEVADQLRSVGEVMDAHPMEEWTRVAKNLPFASPVEGTPTALREIADHVDAWHGEFGLQREHDPRYGRRELAYRFPTMWQVLTNYFGQDGEAIDERLGPRGGMERYVSNAHPGCVWELPTLVVECHEALAVLQTEENLRGFLGGSMGLGSYGLPWLEFLPMVIEVCQDHLRESHPPRFHDERGPGE